MLEKKQINQLGVERGSVLMSDDFLKIRNNFHAFLQGTMKKKYAVSTITKRCNSKVENLKEETFPYNELTTVAPV